MKRYVECMKPRGMRSPHAPIGEQTHPKHGAVKRAGLSIEFLAKSHGPAQVLGRCMEVLNMRIVDDLEFIVVDKRLADRGKVQEQCPQPQHEIRNHSDGFSHYTS